MKVIAFTGSRGWHDRAPIVIVLDDHLDPAECIIVVGDASGADFIVATEAEARGYFVARVRVKPHWRRYGRSAGHKRNAAMLELGVSEVIAFWDGTSPGTGGMIDMARARGLPTTVHYPNGRP